MISYLVLHKIIRITKKYKFLEIDITLIQEQDDKLIVLEILDRARNKAMFFNHVLSI